MRLPQVWCRSSTAERTPSGAFPSCWCLFWYIWAISLSLEKGEKQAVYLEDGSCAPAVFLRLGSRTADSGTESEALSDSCDKRTAERRLFQMYKSMMAVKPEEDIPGVTMTSEKIARMCDACPTLKKLEPYIESSKEYWAGEEGDAESWEVRDGWVFWIFRTALLQAGYYENGAAVNEVCLQIRDELEAAMDAGTLERQPTMPSTYMSPWREGYLGDLFKALGRAAVYTTTYEEMETLVYLYSEPDENGGIPLFERITGDRAVWYKSDLVEASGWYVSYEGMDDISLQAELSDGTVLGTAQLCRKRGCGILSCAAGQKIRAVRNAGFI